MARYLVQVPRDTLSEVRKAGIAKSIAMTRQDVTGEDLGSVQVAITEIDAGCFFAGGRLIECDHIFVHGYVSGGPDFIERKGPLAERMATDVTAAADFDPDSAWVTISEL